MPAKTAEQRRLIAKKAITTRHHPDRDTTDLDREIKALSLEDHIRRVVDTAPELTDEQLSKLASLLRPGMGA
ncbi:MULTISPECIES: hypothetical protein [Streptomyces]|uniref:DUF1707 domain-containing protein n=1 Tax=Streptomyces dengpaensis TaxID=2049881 RepID=A0ABM6SV91_9ACTN|nr:MULTISPECIES: hypothetical protein [Streptomyces]AVH58676.1 hypothetical protein C4B68_26170 [Streptomyces dengpaensis]PIB11265.1 hypothetical protein B1C81_05470 [Streptomyces sp. HG99]